MTSKYTNKNGEKKLLAAVLVLALAFAGCIVILGADDSSATPITAVNEAPNSIGDLETPAAQSFVVKEDKTITSTATAAVTLYVANGVTVTLNGVGSGEVTIVPADANVKNYIDSDSTISITSMTGTVAVKVAYSGSTFVKSTLTVTGNVSNVTTITLSEDGDAVVGAEGIIVPTGTTFTDVKYGAATIAINGKDSYYAPGVNQSFSITAGSQVVSIMDGTYTVTDGVNTIKFSKYKANGTAVTVTGVAGSQEDDPVTMNVKGGAEGDEGSITILKGTVAKVDAGLVSDKFNGIMVDAAADYYQSQIDSTASTCVVYGEVEQKTSVSGITQITVDGTLVIPEGKSIEVGTLVTSSGSMIKLFGSLATTTYSSADGKIYVGPYGDVSGLKNSGDNVAPTGNINVDPSSDVTKSGTISGTESDLILNGVTTIPAGETLTITGKLGLNGKNLNVDGTLILSSGAVLYTLSSEQIVLGPKGTIVNEGTLGTVNNVVVSDSNNTIALSGVSGAQFSVVDGVVGISGDLVANGFVKDADGKADGTVTMGASTIIVGDLTVSEDLTFVADNTVIAAGSDVVIGGLLSGTVTMEAGSSFEVSGSLAVGAVITAESGPIDGAGYVTGAVVFTNVDDSDDDPITGFTIYSVKSKTDVKVYITGSIEDAVNQPSTELNPKITVVGDVYIPAEGLIIGSNVVADFSGAVVYLNGTLSTESEDVTINDYIGAKYQIKTGTGLTAVTTTYYSDVSSAMEKIASSVGKKVSVIIPSVSGVITVSEGQTLEIKVDKIEAGASIIAKKGSTLNIAEMTSPGNIKIDGSVVVYTGATLTGELNAVATIPSDDKTIYAGFQTAIDMVDVGGTLTIEEDPEIDGNLTIKEGVTVIANNLTVNGDLTVPATSKLKAETIKITKIDGGVVTVYGVLDLSEGSLTQDYKLVSPGTTILSSIDTTKMSGAYYTTESGYVLTTVAKAAEQATEGEVVVIGTDVKESGNIVLDGITLRVSATNATLGNIVILDGAKVIAQRAFTATITDAVPETLGAVTSSVSVDGTTVTVTGSEDGLQINALNGKVKVLSGVVTVTGVINNTAEFAVSNGAQAIIAGDLNLTDGVLDVQGDLIVKGKLTIGIATPKIVGTLTALTGSTVSVAGLNVQGSLVAQTDSAVSTTGVITVEEGAVISGKIATGTSYVKAYAGSDVDGMKITASFSAEFYANDVLIATFYAASGITVSDISADLAKDVGAALPGTDTTSVSWKDADGNVIGATISSDSKFYAELGYKKIFINVSVQSGTELRIGTDYYRATQKTSDIYYLETPYTVTATDIAGDKSVIVEFYVNDVKQDITGNQVTFTADMANKKIVILSAYGTAPGPEPTPVDPSEDYIVSTSVVDNNKVIVSVISLDGGYLVAGTEVEVTFTTLVETVAFGQTIYKPTPVTETITIGDDKPTIDNSTYELADILGDKYAVINVISKIGTAGFGNTSLNYKG